MHAGSDRLCVFCGHLASSWKVVHFNGKDLYKAVCAACSMSMDHKTMRRLL